MEMQRTTSIFMRCVTVVCLAFGLVTLSSSSSMGQLYWPMFLSATSGANAGQEDPGDYDIRVPSDYPTIQAAINAAKDGDVILVANGVYKGSGNKNIMFNKPVTLRSEHGPGKTIIDCEGSGRGFVFENDEGKSGRLEGFTIRNGKVSWINGAGSYRGAGGGGIFILNASPVIENCIITDCIATADDSAWGGGIMISDNSKAQIKNSTISNNTIVVPPGGDPSTNGQGGGGVFIQNNSTPTISGCTITGNKTTGWSTGGGIYVKGSNPTISDCIISYNESNINYPVDDSLPPSELVVTNSGGISFREFSGGLVENTTISHNKSQERGGLGCYQSSPTVRNSIIEYNEATVLGGGGVGLYDDSNAQFYDTVIRHNRAEDINNVVSDEQTYGAGISVWTPTPSSTGPSFTRCIIENNIAVGDGIGDPSVVKGSTGGGIFFFGTSATVSNCIIRNNSSDNRPGISISAQSRAVIRDSLIVGNVSNEYGGGISCYLGADAIITNCTVVNNVAKNVSESTGWSSSLISFKSNPVVTNTIFRGNNIPKLVSFESNLVVSYSNVEGGAAGTGNINSDPLFAGADDFHLTAGSPGINRGNNGAPEIGSVDLDGQTRVKNGTVDMGAYEY